MLGSFKPTFFIPYRGICITIYQSSNETEGPRTDECTNNIQQYYYAPILLLEPSTAEYQYLVLKRKHAVSFDVIMWNNDVENAVLDFMQNQLKVNVKRAQLMPVPFEKVLLAFTNSFDEDTWKCPNDWQWYCNAPSGF